MQDERNSTMIEAQSSTFDHSVNGRKSETAAETLPPAPSPILPIALSANRIANGECGGVVLPSHENLYSDPKNLSILENGGVLFCFTCRQSNALSEYETKLVEDTINLSSFEDETRDNYVPHYDIRNTHESAYTMVLTTCSYILPAVDLDTLSADLLSSVPYHKSCQPSGTQVWTNGTQLNTFRITKPIIPYVYSITVQFKVSELRLQDLSQLSQHVGIRLDKGLLLERTKRSIPPKEDATLKAKSVLLYTQVHGGVLVTHLTVVLQVKLPSVVESVVDSLGYWGLGEACETAKKTRCFLSKLRMLSDSINDEEDSFHSTFSSQHSSEQEVTLDVTGGI